MKPGIVPRPREWTPHDGDFTPRDGMRVFATDEALRLARPFADELALPLAGTGEGTPSVAVGFAAENARLRPPEHAEGFVLEVTGESVVVVAQDVAGLRYGLAALRQLRLDDGAGDGAGRGSRYAAGSASDHPGLGLRGIHLDLKGAMPTAEFLERVMRALGDYRINAVLLEYEDKFPYRSHPELVADDALTGAELDRILAVAAGCGIQVIPLVQCLGHAEHVLRKAGY